jgi:peptidoglycan LD-endopeptidase CwlK
MTVFTFGQTSRARLATCHPKLQTLMSYAMGLQLMDFTILQGHRGEVEQNAAFRSGASKLEWPKSKHNTVPSIAVDIAPWPIRWGNVGEPDRIKAIGAFYKLAGIVLAASREVNVLVRWGGDWNMNGDIFDNRFDDLVHFELRNA